MTGESGALHVAVRLTRRAAEPLGQRPRRVRSRHARLEQVRGGVDPLGNLIAASPATTNMHSASHVTSVLLDMSRTIRNTPWQLHPAVAQRHLETEVANCVGGAISPVLANLYMHHALELWLTREFPTVAFERYAGDAVVHCVTRRQAEKVLTALHERMAEVGLELHPNKTEIVYCKDANRCADFEHISFTFLGYTFRARQARRRDGVNLVSLMAISKDAVKKIGKRVRTGGCTGSPAAQQQTSPG